MKAVLTDHPQDISLRTIRRRFLFASGLPIKMISPIKRAKQAATFLEQDVLLLGAAYQTSYADQSPMARALKHFIGDTPAHIACSGSKGESDGVIIP